MESASVSDESIRNLNIVRCSLVAAAFVLISYDSSVTPFAAELTVNELVLQRQNERIETIKRIAPAVVAIFDKQAQGGGSGVLISADGFVVTNYHVVTGQGGFLKCGLNDGRVYDAVLVGIDPTGDVALIQLQGRSDFPAAQLGDSDQVRVGDFTFALGNPFLLATDFQPTVTYGMVSGVHRYQYPAGTFIEYTDCIQVDTSINPGNSGGPLFNEAGEVVGINGRISVEKRGKVNVGAGYAISINQVMNFLDHLKSGRIVDHATLGATVRSDSSGAVIVRSVLQDSAVARRGLQTGDELVSFAGRPIRSVNQFKNILGIYPRGWRVPLTYVRDGEQREIVVRLPALHTAAELTPDEVSQEEPDTPPRPAPRPQAPEEPEQPDEPRPFNPLEALHSIVETPPPAQYAHMFEERRGFANYYFNALHSRRLLASLQEFGDYSKTSHDLWTLAGTGANNTPVQFKLSEETLAAKVGDQISLQQLSDEPADEPAGSGGLLMALHQFRQLLSNPDQAFTEVYYVGSEPGDDGQRVDVLITTRGLIEARWYFSQGAPQLIGVDVALSEEVDPCEIRFNGRMISGDRRLPQQWHVRQGDHEYLQFTLESLSVAGGQP